jgi:hypothetical protein
MDALDLVRKSRARRASRISVGVDLRARGIARRLREERAVSQARIQHQEWLARASSRLPDLWHAEAPRQPEQAQRAKIRLRAELRRELAQERVQGSG